MKQRPICQNRILLRVEQLSSTVQQLVQSSFSKSTIFAEPSLQIHLIWHWLLRYLRNAGREQLRQLFYYRFRQLRDQHYRKRIVRRSDGHTVAECLVAFAMLVPIAVIIGRIGLHAEQSNRASLIASHLLCDLINARESIGSWEFDDVSISKIESMSFLENSESRPDSRIWQATVDEVIEPIPAKRVYLSLKWTHGQSDSWSEVGPIIFWVPKP